MKSRLIGKRVYITDKKSMYNGEWGIIVDYDGDVYHVAIARDRKHHVIFDRNQFRVPRKTCGDQKKP